MGSMKSAEVSNHRRACHFCQQHYWCPKEETHEACVLPMPLEGEQKAGVAGDGVIPTGICMCRPQETGQPGARSEKPQSTRSHNPSAADTPFCFQSLRRRTPRGGIEAP